MAPSSASGPAGIGVVRVSGPHGLRAIKGFHDEALRGKRISSERERVEAMAAFEKAQAAYIAAKDTARYQVRLDYSEAARERQLAEGRRPRRAPPLPNACSAYVTIFQEQQAREEAVSGQLRILRRDVTL